MSGAIPVTSSSTIWRPIGTATQVGATGSRSTRGAVLPTGIRRRAGGSSCGRSQAGVLQRQPRVPFGRPFGPMTVGLLRRAGGLLGPVLRGARGEWLALAVFFVVATAAVWLSSPGSFVPDIKPEVYLAPWR